MSGTVPNYFMEETHIRIPVHLKNIWHNRESSRGPCSRGFSVKRVKLQMSLVLRVEETFRHPKPWVGIKIERVGARVREWEWQHQLKRTLKTWHRNSCIISTLCLREASRTSTLIFLFQNNYFSWNLFQIIWRNFAIIWRILWKCVCESKKKLTFPIKYLRTVFFISKFYMKTYINKMLWKYRIGQIN